MTDDTYAGGMNAGGTRADSAEAAARAPTE